VKAERLLHSNQTHCVAIEQMRKYSV